MQHAVRGVAAARSLRACASRTMHIRSSSTSELPLYHRRHDRLSLPSLLRTFPTNYGAVTTSRRVLSTSNTSASTTSASRSSFLSRLSFLSAPSTRAAGDETTAPSSSTDHDAQPEQPRIELRRLLSVARPESRLIGAAMIAQSISAASTLLFPLALGRIVDAVQTVPDGATAAASGALGLDALVLGMGAIFTVSSVATAGRVALLSLAGSRVSRSLRTQLFEKILHQETAFFDRRQSGELVNRLSSDVAAVSRTLTDNLAKLVRAGITCGSSLALVVYLSPELSMIALGAFPPIIAFAYVFGRNARKLSRALVDALAAATQVAAERIGAIKTVRVFGAERSEANRYKNAVDQTYQLARKVARADGIYAGSIFYAAQMSLLGVLWLGGRMVADPLNPMTVGTLTSFSMYAVNLGVSLSSIGNAYGQLSRALGAGHRVFEVIDRVPENSSSTLSSSDLVRHANKQNDSFGSENLQTLPEGYNATVDFHDVSFSYPTAPDTPVLNGLTLSARPGEIVAVAGTSGSGKSTLASLLLRLYEPGSGKILFGDTPINSLDTEWLRGEIALVPQEPVLFDGSIADNIRYGAPDADIVRAARAAASYEMIQGLPEGFDTRVGERGLALSGGQRARVALARALARRPRVLVLDEHSAALDAESERAVGGAVSHAAREMNVAVLVVAHRISSLRRADRVVVLRGGRIVEEGRFEDLVSKKNGVLGEMVNAAQDDSEIHAQG